jgi:2-phosphoglycerate kinase
VSKYLDRFDQIRRVQEYLVRRAEASGTPVIENENADRATRAVAELVLSAAERA